MSTLGYYELKRLYTDITSEKERVEKFAKEHGGSCGPYHIVVKKDSCRSDSDYGFCWSIREKESYMTGSDCPNPSVIYDDGKAERDLGNDSPRFKRSSYKSYTKGHEMVCGSPEFIEQIKKQDMDREQFDQYLKEGQELIGQDKLEQAVQKFSSALRIFPNAVTALNQRGNCYVALNRLEDALADFNHLIENNPKDSGFYNNRAAVFIKMGEYDKAIKDCKNAIEFSWQKPPNVVLSAAYANCAIAEKHKGETGNALSDYNKAIKAHGANVRAFINRGLIFTQKGRYRKGIKDFTSAISIEPSSGEAYYYRGVAWEKRGKTQKAQADFDKAKGLGFSPK